MSILSATLALTERRRPLRRLLHEVLLERERQDEKWGQQDHPDGTGGSANRMLANEVRDATDRAFRDGRGTWKHVLREEYAEAMAESDPTRLRKELIQVAAVAVAWVEAIDRRTA